LRKALRYREGKEPKLHLWSLYPDPLELLPFEGDLDVYKWPLSPSVGTVPLSTYLPPAVLRQPGCHGVINKPGTREIHPPIIPVYNFVPEAPRHPNAFPRSVVCLYLLTSYIPIYSVGT
jgi:hypothetical protein